jgi:fibronectin-binding autotransporter adhesin
MSLRQKSTRRYLLKGFSTLVIFISAFILMNLGFKKQAFASANYIWVGTTSNINTASNWSPNGVPSAGNTYTFGNTGTTTTVTGNPAPGVLIVVNSSAGVKDYTISGVLSGATTVTKNGSSTLTLTGANTFTGGTTLSAGVLNINNASALGSVAGTFTINGGTIDNTSAAAITTVNYPQIWNGNFAFTGTRDLNMGNGAVTMSSSRQITTFTAARTLTIGGVISGGTFRLTKGGVGTLTLNGVNTFTGGVTINAGELSVATIGNGGVAGNLGQASNAAANLVLGGGTLRYTGATASTDRAFTLTSGTNSSIDVPTNILTFSGSSANSTGALTKIGSGGLTLSGAN